MAPEATYFFIVNQRSMLMSFPSKLFVRKGIFVKSLMLFTLLAVFQDVVSVTTNRIGSIHPSERSEKVRELAETHKTPSTQGPRQPEVQSFLPAGVNDIVNPFTGDFSYSIPLLDVGGYPVHIYYQSGVSMEDEASWVGLGWNLTPGAVNRMVRGLPDDFSGAEKIEKEVRMKDNETWALRSGPNTELFGFGLGASLGMQYNTYTGFGLELGANVETSVPMGDLPASLGAGAGITLSSGGGFSRNLNASLNLKLAEQQQIGDYGMQPSAQVNAGITSNSRAGMSARFGAGFNASLTNTANRPSLQISGINYPLSFAREVYTPQIDLPYAQKSFSFTAKAGGEVQGVTFSGFSQGSYSSQYLASRRFTHPAYGYLYSEKGQDDKDALFDFNRDHANPFEPENPQLPMTQFSYDVYSVSGQGFSGSFRPFRTDVGTLRNNTIQTTADNIGGGVEAAAGSLVKIGVDGSFSSVQSYSGKWREDNSLEKDFSFREAGDDRSETFYFKNIGEPTAMSNEEHFRSLEAFEPFPLALKKNGLKAPTLSRGRTEGGWQPVRGRREVRNSDLTVLTFSEKKLAALEKTIRLFPPNSAYDTVLNNRIPFDASDEQKRSRQIAEIRITKDDGSRYYYDLPVYNTRKREISFSIGGAVSPAEAGNASTVVYVPGRDNSAENRRGRMQHFSATETPAHAYAYMLTAIVSPDYTDLSGDGPSPDDLGSYTKFNYTKSSARGAWRMPVRENTAFFQKGVEADPQDDMAHYTYGEKEIFYLHSIETRNHVAEFRVSPRQDVLAVKGENGGVDNQSAAMKLDSILLYTKADRVKNGRNAVPVKRVAFTYNYSLCRNHPGSSGGQGKLTLQGIEIAYRQGNKTRLSPYRFRYSDVNPAYSEDGSDRWGTYRKDSAAFPLQEKYTPQMNRSRWMDRWASAWLLTEIENPNGGTMNVFYESDDYGYVQEKRAMQMLRIRGLSSSAEAAPVPTVYNGSNTRNYVHFDLLTPIRSDDPDKERWMMEYVQGVQDVFFQVRTNTRFGRGAAQELVNGFARFTASDGFGQSYGLSAPLNGQHTSGWIRLSNEPGYEEGVLLHPFAQAAFQMVRTQYAEGGNVALNQNSSADQVVTAFSGLVDALQEAVGGGFSNRLLSEGIGNTIETASSFIRLNHPQKQKLGGGSRVRRIELHDNWQRMTQQRDSSYFYGMEYDYTRTETVAGATRAISSGVASYEPLTGGEENPYVLPRRYNVKLDVLGLSFGPTERKMETQPYGEGFFPGPSVGYSMVKIRQLRRQGVTVTASGFTQKEFYTAKDFPVVYKASTPGLEQLSIPALPLPLVQVGLDQLTVVQSHVVELNDMHGKEKAEWEFRESDSLHPISGVEYHYKRASAAGGLNNTIQVAEPDGQVRERLAGVEFDMVADMREYDVQTTGVNVQANVDVIMAGFFPIPIPVPVPTIIQDYKLFRTYTTNKIIQRSGLLEKMVIHDKGQVSILRNEVLDAVTGLVILSSEVSESDEPIYTLTVPSHWKYPVMAPAYVNSGRSWSNIRVVNGRLAIPQAERIFFKGDELLIGNRMAWVHRVSSGNLELIDELGRPWGSVEGAVLKVVRSGRRNMQGLTVSNVVCAENPVSNGRIGTPQKVLDAEITTYSDTWQTYAGFNIMPERYRCSCPEPDPCQKEVLQEMVRIALRERLYDAATVIRHRPSKELTARILSCWSLSASGGNLWLHFTYGDSSVVIRVMNGDEVVCTLRLQLSGTSGLQQFPAEAFSKEPPDDASAKTKGKFPPPDYIPQGLQFSDGCGNDPGGFSVRLVLQMAGRQTQVQLNGTSECLQRTCTLEKLAADTFCTVSAGNNINPYRLGLLGNVRALASYDYMTERTTGALKNAGYYRQFTDFDFSAEQHPNWQFKLRNVTIDPFGKTLESVDALGRFDASFYAYDRHVKAAEAVNARYRQLAFDSFEDYAFSNDRFTTGECALPQHFSFVRHWNALTRCDTVSHTGYASFRVSPGKSYTESRLLRAVPDDDPPADNVLAHRQQIGVFNPDTGRYVLQAWVYQENSNQRDSGMVIEVSVAGSQAQRVRFSPEGSQIDGWRLLSGEFRIPAGSTSISIKLENQGRINQYVDDLRIFPYDARMTTYTVDPQLLRVMAVLDENHFATYYDYDEEGQLARIRKETEDGVFTIREIRSSKPKAQR